MQAWPAKHVWLPPPAASPAEEFFNILGQAAPASSNFFM
jgi:hypothetical protein